MFLSGGNGVGRPPRGKVTALAVALVALLSTSACGAGESASGTGASSKSALSAAQQQELEKIIADAEAEVPWKNPGPAVDVSGLKGKRVFVLNDDQSNPFQAALLQGVKDAGKAAGISVDIGDGQGNITRDIQLINNAVHSKVDAIILDTIPPNTVAPALVEAKAAGIPVIAGLYGNPGHVFTAENEKLGVVGDGTFEFGRSGALAADYAIAATKGNVNAVIMTVQGFVLSQDIEDGFVGELKKYCPETCKYKVVKIPLATLSQAITSAAQVGAQDPNVNVMFPMVDNMIAFAMPPVKAAKAQDRIMFVSTNSDLAPMQQLAKGEVKALAGNPPAWDGWVMMDQALRAMAGMPNAADSVGPLRMFNERNIKSVDLKADVATWFGKADYEGEYKKLWGVG
jgi:ribose transport system substrate-binding protein